MTPAQEYKWGQMVLEHEQSIDRDYLAPGSRGTPGFESEVFPTARSQHYRLGLEIQLVPNDTEIFQKPFIGRYQESSVRTTFSKLLNYGALTLAGYKGGGRRTGRAHVYLINEYNRQRMNKALCLCDEAIL